VRYDVIRIGAGVRSARADLTNGALFGLVIISSASKQAQGDAVVVQWIRFIAGVSHR
jgi:hypothetical protein